MNINDITITSLETINAFDIVTGAYKFTLDELQNATIAQTQEKTDITGKQGRKLNSLKKNKAVTVSGTNGLVSGGLLELQVGSEFENKKTTVKWTDYLTVTGNAAATQYKAVGTTGNVCLCQESRRHSWQDADSGRRSCRGRVHLQSHQQGACLQRGRDCRWH